jgi:hypothetical protein
MSDKISREELNKKIFLYIFDTITNIMNNIVMLLLFTSSKVVIHGSEYHLKCRVYIYVVRTKIYVNKFAIFYCLTPTGNYQM